MNPILKRVLIAALFFSSAACYGNTIIEQNNVFKCETNDDCIAGYKCDTNKFCVEDLAPDVGGCTDNDGDGYGVGDPTQIVNCPACKKNKNDCVPDCDDNNPLMYPGKAEVCDGLDNNCDDKVDNFEPGSCAQKSECVIDSNISSGFEPSVNGYSAQCPLIDNNDPTKPLAFCVYTAKCGGTTDVTLKCENGKLVCP